MINVLLIEDSAVFVMGLKLALGADPAIGRIESVTSPGAAVAYLNAHPDTDIAVVDITLQAESDGLTLLGILRDAFPGVKAMVLSHYKIPSYILRAITSGASAYLAKDSSPSPSSRRSATWLRGNAFSSERPSMRKRSSGFSAARRTFKGGNRRA